MYEVTMKHGLPGHGWVIRRTETGVNLRYPDLNLEAGDRVSADCILHLLESVDPCALCDAMTKAIAGGNASMEYKR